MIHFVFSEKDTRYLFLKYDTPEDEKWLAPNNCYEKQHNLTNYLNLIDPKCHLRNYNGPILVEEFLFEYVQSNGKKIYYCSIGLWQEIYKFFRDNKVEYDGLEAGFFKRSIQHTFQEFKDIVDSWGLKFNPRPYQYECAYKILNWKRSVSELATRAGKTLIAYMIYRYAVEYLGAKRMLMIVPSIDLVQQGFNDFNDYKEFFKMECIWAGGELVESANLTIGTFQSLIKFLEKKTPKGEPNPKYNPHFFDGYDIVFVDETHRAKAAQIKTIISQPFMLDVKIAYGMTGTLPQERTIERFCIHSLIGAKIQEITTAQLKEAGYISDIEIYQYRLKYRNIEKQIKLFIQCAEYSLCNYIEVDNPKKPGQKKRVELAPNEQHFLMKYEKSMPIGLQMAKNNIYSDPIKSDIMKDIEWVNLLKLMMADAAGANGLMVERMMIHSMSERVDILCNEILPKCDKNTLILCHHTEYINYLTDIIEEKFGKEHIVVKITGSVGPKKRNQIKQQLKDNNNCILIASYGCMSTGITLSDLCYGVLFESFKSNVVNMQSIGRGLGLSDIKDKYRLFDIVDCFENTITNKIFLQGLERIKIYKSDFNKHKYFIKEFNIDKNGDYNEKYKVAYQKYLDLQKEQKPKKKEPKKSEVETFMDDLFG